MTSPVYLGERCGTFRLGVVRLYQCAVKELPQLIRLHPNRLVSLYLSAVRAGFATPPEPPAL